MTLNSPVVPQAATAPQARVLIVDDEAPIRMLMAEMLRSAGYSCAVAAGARGALDHLQAEPFDLVITDMMMEGDSGLSLIRTMNANHPDVAIIMCTGVDDPQLGQTAISLGAYGYILKPFDKTQVLVSAYNALRRRRLEIESRQHREMLEKTVAERTKDLREALVELKAAQIETIRRLGLVAEFRDDETGAHIHRMSRYSETLAKRLGLPKERCELIFLASPMHDIGKVGIPDAVLLKPGRHTAEEQKIMQRHVEIGHKMLSGSKSEMLNVAATIAWTHHERFDGTGYPRGLKGDAIPIEGRIVAVADVFDALLSKRVYKPAYTLEKTLDIMREGRGAHFDPAVLDCFFASLNEILEIRSQILDE